MLLPPWPTVSAILVRRLMDSTLPDVVLVPTRCHHLRPDVMLLGHVALTQLVFLLREPARLLLARTLTATPAIMTGTKAKRSMHNLLEVLQEAVRRQRNVSDQKRRDDLKGGFKRLRSALPTDRKLSYAELLKYAVQYIMDLIATRDQLKAELETTKDELNAYRLRYANEAQGWARPDAGIVPGSF
ncbi:hypothetical protein BDP27DRAFT_527147 [Rhodocollybia butyracea]|uniref:BHLH domain-containing protein n=1 Tax=Rhodocollybia butyracea TaxID=206335 RepID=A0A9P5PSC7_9AGAR|nr:hypothetical protein BDP27DRAFT_527147 [Rhodocollybia butyracea]